MPSLLNVSNDSKPDEFSLKDIEVFVDSEEQNWFKRAHVGKCFVLEDIRSSLNGLEKYEILTRQELLPTRRGLPGWSGSKDQQNKTNKFLSLFRVMHVIVNSKKDKGKELKEHILKDIVPRGFDVRIEEIQKKHQEAIKGKDTVIALINDDLQGTDDKIQAIKYENVALQAQKDVYQVELQKCQDTITHLKTRYVPHWRNRSKGLHCTETHNICK